MPHKTSKSNTRNFDINGNVSGGADGGISAEGPYASANLEAGIGVGAGWSTTEEYEVDEWSIGKISDGAKAGQFPYPKITVRQWVLMAENSIQKQTLIRPSA